MTEDLESEELVHWNDTFCLKPAGHRSKALETWTFSCFYQQGLVFIFDLNCSSSIGYLLKLDTFGESVKFSCKGGLLTIPLESKRHARLIESFFFAYIIIARWRKILELKRASFARPGWQILTRFSLIQMFCKRGRIKVFLSGAQYSEKNSCSFVDVV